MVRPKLAFILHWEESYVFLPYLRMDEEQIEL